MKRLGRVLGISLLPIVFLLFSVTSRADPIPIEGFAGYASGEEFSFGFSGPSLLLHSTSPDAPNFLPICGGDPICTPGLTVAAWSAPGYSGGYLNGIVANVLGGSVSFGSNETFDILPGYFGFTNVPVWVSGQIYGFGTQGWFALDIVGMGTAYFEGWSEGGLIAVNEVGMNLTSGTATIIYETTPEPSSFLLVASALALIGVGRRLRPRSAGQIG